MRSLHVKRWLALALIPVLGAMLPNGVLAATPASKSSAPAKAAPSTQFVDGIAAVVNKKVITLQQVDAEAKSAQEQLKRQNIPVPDYDTLRKQVLSRMITEELERQEAQRLGIRVNDAQVQQAVQTIAQRNRISTERLRQEVEKTGVAWNDYLKNLRQEVTLDMLRQRAVDSTITISDAEIDNFLKGQGNQLMPPAQAPGAPAPAPAAPEPAAPQRSGPQVLGLAQILVTVPEGAPAAKVEELRRKAEGLLARVRSGADFAGVAAASSDDPQALNGGQLGVRPVDGWPDLFLKETEGLKPGEVSEVFQSGQGFHILK
ncbi:MAG TPA: peptidylprolyl isomerase, partial [Burkholderiaceae bacterium]|nr:peptidylprolyl isomerase [Burkholderiaceae bacterium]